MNVFIYFLKVICNRPSYILYIDFRSTHCQFFRYGSSQRNDNPGDNICYDKTFQRDSQYQEDYSYPCGIPTKVSSQTGCHTSQYFIIRITEQPARSFCCLRISASILRCFPSTVSLITQVFGLTHLSNDFLYIFYRNHLFPIS